MAFPISGSLFLFVLRGTCNTRLRYTHVSGRETSCELPVLLGLVTLLIATDFGIRIRHFNNKNSNMDIAYTTPIFGVALIFNFS